MKKLRLDLDLLAVQSFETHAAGGGGTVIGAVQTVDQAPPTRPGGSEIDNCPSAWGGCSDAGTCYDTCKGCPSQAGTCAGCDTFGFNTGCNGCSGPICLVPAAGEI